MTKGKNKKEKAKVKKELILKKLQAARQFEIDLKVLLPFALTDIIMVSIEVNDVLSSYYFYNVYDCLIGVTGAKEA